MNTQSPSGQMIGFLHTTRFGEMVCAPGHNHFGSWFLFLRLVVFPFSTSIFPFAFAPIMLCDVKLARCVLLCATGSENIGAKRTR